MARTLEFIFDFASPNAYLAWRALPPILARTGAAVIITPCLLGGIFKATNNQAPFVAFGPVKGKMDYEMLETRRFVKAHGLTAFAMNPHFPMNTLLVMRAFVAAQDLGVGEAFMEAVLRAMWEDGRKMDDPEVVAAVLAEAGLDAAAILAHAQTPPIKARLMENTQGAADRGVFGIPSFFVGEELFFGKERLAQVEAELAAA